VLKEESKEIKGFFSNGSPMLYAEISQKGYTWSGLLYNYDEFFEGFGY
jgi:hypothetical protein